MCGINGTLAFTNGTYRVTLPELARMRDTMAHRGPDGADAWVAPDGRIGLAHRRLSIVDLSEAASQPMSNEDGTLWITYNGEIYNHAEIRRELSQSGRHRWKTDHSDTEVILHAFEEWGIDCLSRFRGMFAFGLWDARARELWLVRDRIGIKPLYYSVHHGRLTFASEIKALLEDADQRRGGRRDGAVPLPVVPDDARHRRRCSTASESCRRARGFVSGPTARSTERRYWDVWDDVSALPGGEDEIAERVLAELRTAVQPAQGERRAGRRVSLRRARLEHQRRALL